MAFFPKVCKNSKILNKLRTILYLAGDLSAMERDEDHGPILRGETSDKHTKVVPYPT